MNLNIPDRHPEYDSSRSKSTSPNRTARISEYTGSNLFIEKLRKKDKEIYDLRRECEESREKIREFEFLIVKASDEVKRKQIEINSLNQIIQSQRDNDLPGQVSILHRDLTDSKSQIKNYENVLTQLRSELLKEREQSKDLFEKNKDLKHQLEKLASDSKSAADNYQKSYAQLAQRYAKAEKDLEESTNNYVEITKQHELKDQTITQAHQVLKKLKEELEESKAQTAGARAEIDELEKKVKEYKSKCKTLKSNNLKHLERIRELEGFEKEIAQAREEVQNYVKARIEDRGKFSSERDRLSNENQEYTLQTSRLRHELESLTQEKVQVELKLSIEQTKTQNLTSILEEKESIISKLTLDLAQVEDKYKKEIDSFKSQAIKTFQIANDLPPLPSRNVSPFKQPPQTPQIQQVKDFNLHTQNSEPPEKTSRIPSKSIRKSAVIKTTPMRSGQSRLETVEILLPSSPEQNKNDPPVSNEPLQTSMLITQSQEVITEPPQSNQEPVKPPVKEPLTIEFLKEQLKKSMDREHYYALVIENIAAEAEANTRVYLEKAKNNPLVPIEYEAWRMHCEELETRYANLVEKYQNTSKLVFDLLQNNKLLADRVSELTYNLKYSTMCFNDFSRTLIYENVRRDDYCNGLLSESKNLFTAIELQEQAYGLRINQNGELLMKMTAEVERLKSEIQQVDDMCDSYRVRELNIKDPTSTNPSPIKSPMKSAPHKVNSIINHFRSTLAEIDQERKFMMERYGLLEKEYKDIKTGHINKEKDFKETFKKLEHVIKEKDAMLDNKNLEIKEIERLFKEELEKSKQEVLQRDADFSKSLKEFSSNLREKQDNISTLMHDKQNMAQVIESISTELSDAKHKIESLTKELKSTRENLIKERADKEFALREAAAKEAAAKEMVREAQRDKENFTQSHASEDLPHFAPQEKVQHSATQRRNLWTERLEKREITIEENIDRLDSNSKTLRRPLGERSTTPNGNYSSRREKEKEREQIQKQEELNKEILTLTSQISQQARDIANKDKLISDLQGQVANLSQDIIELDNRLQNFSILNQKSEDRTSYNRPEGDSLYKPENSIHSRLSIRSRKPSESQFGNNGEFERLKTENAELLQKLQHLNELVATNRLLEFEMGGTQRTTSSHRERDQSPFENTSRSPFRMSNRFTDKPSPINRKDDFNGTDMVNDAFGHTGMLQDDRELNQKMDEHIPEKDILAHIESYKAKTKKILHKRVKELEMILRYVDLKLRGFNFAKSCFINSSASKAFLNYDEVKSNAKIGSFVEHLIQKNPTLKTFVDSMCSTAEKLHTRQHNFMILSSRLIKTIMISSDHEVTTEVYSSAVGPELEMLFGMRFPHLASKFDQIETLDMMDSKGDFFEIFERLEPKFELLCDMLTEMVTFTRKDNNYDSRSVTGSTTNAKMRDYLNTKVDKLKDIEGLYYKLKNIIERNNATSLPSLQDNLKNYVQTFDNIFQALNNECKALINFSSSMPRERTTIPTIATQPQYTSVNNKENSNLRIDYNSISKDQSYSRSRHTPGKYSEQSPLPDRRTSMNTMTTPDAGLNRNLMFNLENFDRLKSSRENDELAKSGRTTARRFLE